MRWRDGKFRLDLYGETRESTFRHPDGEASIVDLFHTARMLSEAITARSVENARKEGFEISCRSGCAACCRQLVPISTLEATWLETVVAAMPKPRQKQIRERFAAAVQRMEEVGLLDPDAERGDRRLLARDHEEGETDFANVSRRYYAMKVACPFLEKESCGIYESRPMICREYHVVTPKEHCETLSPKTQGVPWPLRMSEVLTAVGNELSESDERGVPFTMALEWAAAKGSRYREKQDGQAMTDVLMSTIAARMEDPTELRPIEE